MLRTPTIVQIACSNPRVYAFSIRGEVTGDDLKGMAEVMNEAFDRHQQVSMLLRFENFEGAELGAGFDLETIKSQFRSLAKVEKYAVVGAPTGAAAAIEVMDKIIPVDARTFDYFEENRAWDFVEARSIPHSS